MVGVVSSLALATTNQPAAELTWVFTLLSAGTLELELLLAAECYRWPTTGPWQLHQFISPLNWHKFNHWMQYSYAAEGLLQITP